MTATTLKETRVNHGVSKNTPANDRALMTSVGDPDAPSHFKSCHCGCTAGQRVTAVFLTALAFLQILALAFSLNQSAPRAYENTATVKTSLGAQE